MARRRSAWRTRLIADGVRAPVQPRGVLAKFEDLYSANADRQAAKIKPTGATVDGIRVPRMRAGAMSLARFLGGQPTILCAARVLQPNWRPNRIILMLTLFL